MQETEIVRMLGAILAFLSCGAMGIMRINSARRHLASFEALYDAMGEMKLGISTRLEAIPALTKRLSESAVGDAKEFFTLLSLRLDTLGERGLYELWRESAEETLTALTPGELHDFLSLGLVLGKSEADEQAEAIGHCQASIGRALNAARDKYPQQRRLALGLSSAAGMLLVIVLI